MAGVATGAIVEVFSLTGQRAATLTATQGSTVDVSGLVPGT